MATYSKQYLTGGAADGTGAINIASGKTITAGGAVTLIGADFGISGSISAGSNNITIGQSAAGTLALGTVVLGSVTLGGVTLQV